MEQLIFEREQREVSYQVAGVDPVTLPDGQALFPDHVILVLVAEPDKRMAVTEVIISGAKQLKTGKPGIYRTTSYNSGDRLELLPEWVQGQIQEEVG